MAVMQTLNIADCLVEPHLLSGEGEDNVWHIVIAMLASKSEAACFKLSMEVKCG